jgi:hypothetical protein
MDGRLVLDDGASVLGRLIDLSVGGVLFAADQPFDEGRSCRIEVLVGDTEGPALVRAEGLTGRKTPSGTAIAFTNMDVESYDALRDLVLAYADDPQSVIEEFRAHLGLRRRDDL